MGSTVGRDGELRDVAAFVDPGAAARVLLIEGEPGIGKTTVWEAAAAAAQEHWRVLHSRPLEVEARISFAAIGDLLGGCLDEVVRTSDPFTSDTWRFVGTNPFADDRPITLKAVCVKG